MIRAYQATDAKAVRHIAKYDAPNDAAMNAVCAVRCDYFIDLEPENGFVIADEFDKPVGYILCSVNRERFDNVYPSYIAKLKRYKRSMFKEHQKLFKQTSNIPADYTARFVINVLPSFRGKGSGKALVERLARHLRGMNIHGAYVVADNTSTAAFCERLGFEKIIKIDAIYCVYGIRL